MNPIMTEKILYEIPHNELKSEIVNILKYAKDFVNKIYNDNKLSYIEQIQIIEDHMYYVNYYYSNIGLFRSIDDNKYLEEIDKIIFNYFEEFYSNPLLLKLLKTMKKSTIQKNNSIDNKNIIIIKNLIKICEDHTNKIILDFNNKINMYEQRIYDINKKNIPIITSNDEIKKLFLNNDKSITEIPFKLANKILLTRTNYYYLQKKIKNPEVRNEIEKVYFKNNDEMLNNLAKIILCRHGIALNMSSKTKIYKNYFEYKQRDNSENSTDIKKLITNLLHGIDNKITTEISIIKEELLNDGYKNKKTIDQHDIIFYYEKLKNHTKFTPIMALNLIEYVLKKFFNIVMKRVDYKEHKLWANDIITYILMHNNKLLGYVYFDILHRNNKINTPPMFVSITNMYCPKNIDKLKHIQKTQHSVILASFPSLGKECLSINDLSSLFREFGHVIQQTTNILFYDNTELRNLFPQIFEYLIYNEKILEKICFGKGNKDLLIKHFNFMKKLNFCISLKIRGVNAMFDHSIHNSVDVINWIQQNIDVSGKALLDIYTTIYKEIMKDVPKKETRESFFLGLPKCSALALEHSSVPSINTDINGINHSIILQELSPNAGKLYENIIIELLGFGLYKIICDGDGEKLLSLLLNNKFSLKKNIDTFIKDNNIDTFSLFTNEFC